MIYTANDWEKDILLNKFCEKHANWFHSGCNIACPNCQTFGFYGPKLSFNEETREINRKYRACKFCGFWQEVDNGESYFCIPLYCTTCNLYDWTAPKEEQDYKSCRKCGTQFKKIDWAFDNPNHYFHILKEKMDSIHSMRV